MKNFLVVKDPFPTQECEVKKCLLCDSSKQRRIPCNASNVGYQLVCETCEDKGVSKVYEGETGRSARVRGAEHLNSFLSGRPDNPLFKQKTNDHQDEEIKFRMEITKKFRDPLSRQANEAVRISGRKKNELLNSKTEFNHPPIARISVERKTKNFTSPKFPHPAQPSL